MRSTYVAKLWCSVLINNIEVPDITVHGWTANGQIKWLEHEFPDDVKEILCDVNQCEVYYESESSGDEDDNDITYDIVGYYYLSVFPCFHGYIVFSYSVIFT